MKVVVDSQDERPDQRKRGEGHLDHELVARHSGAIHESQERHKEDRRPAHEFDGGRDIAEANFGLTFIHRGFGP